MSNEGKIEKYSSAVYRARAKDADVCIQLGLRFEESYFNSSQDK